ncbi:hypothetical protein CI238_03804, partial [Colletotrichum incanum]
LSHWEPPSTWEAFTCSTLRAFAGDVDGEILHTSATGITAATPAWFWSTDESTKRISHTNPTRWPKRTPPCVRSWFAATSRSTAACLPATASCKGCRPLRPPVAPRRAVTRRPVTARETATADLVTTLAAAPRPPLTKDRTAACVPARPGDKSPSRHL